MDKISLCPACSACPEVVVDGDTVRIGEEGNVVSLKKAEWNVLVDVIKSGKVGKLKPGTWQSLALVAGGCHAIPTSRSSSVDGDSAGLYAARRGSVARAALRRCDG